MEILPYLWIFVKVTRDGTDGRASDNVALVDENLQYGSSWVGGHSTFNTNVVYSICNKVNRAIGTGKF